MSTDGFLNFRNTKRATFVGPTSNISFDTVNSSLGIGVTGRDPPSSNLYITGNAYVTSDFSLGGVLKMGTVNVVARHTLEAITATGNTSPFTMELTNTDTSLVASGNVEVAKELTVSGNVEVAKELTVSGNVEVGTANLFVDTTTGNVGIGTTNPSHTLTVATTSGDAEVHIQAQGNDGGDAILYFNGSATNQRKCAIISSNVAPASYCKQDLHFCMETTNDLSDVDITDSKMVITNAGNVGIGTTNPSDALHVYGSLMVQYSETNSQGTDNDWYRVGTWEVPSDGSGNGANLKLSFLGGRGYAAHLREGMGESIIYARILNDNTQSEANITGSWKHEGSNLIFSDVKFKQVGTNRYKYEVCVYMKYYTEHTMKVECSRTTSFTREFTDISDPGANSITVQQAVSLPVVDSDGNLGIGTTNPNWILEIEDGDNSITHYGPNTSWGGRLSVGAANDKTAANDSATAQCISTNGNLHLDAADNRDIYLCHYRGNNVRFGSNIIHSSDDRLKSEEELIMNATDTLLKLNPQKYKKTYTLREDESREPFIESGLMAQDVWYDAPELRHLVHLGADANPTDTKPVAPVDGDIQQDPDYSSWGTETAALNYDGLIAYLIKSNQELHARIQALENA